MHFCDKLLYTTLIFSIISRTPGKLLACKWPHQTLQNLIHNFLHELNRCHLPKNHSLLFLKEIYVTNCKIIVTKCLFR
ncbi:hypothetical protein BpHYR1_039464 [Brachionus plicatilis]|uniref:Uncharacterized protein n=1 Tax=Brachionus plicatilis TaxID=10195 RepID=A0A3M7PAH5_BRAPC|nr:hypothetical protein BpHYR1_039464 [Brachionus plicatilis]